MFILAWHLSVEASAQDRIETLEDSLISIVEVPAEDTDTTRFDRIDSQETIQLRTVSRFTLDSLRNDADYWYANLAPQRKKAEEPAADNKTIFREKWFRDLLWIIILGSFVGVVIWYLVSSNILLFRKKSRSIATEEAEEINTDDIFSIRYEPEITKAENAGNFRFAIRLWYLYQLKELSEYSLIDYRPGRTNHDYIVQLQKTPYGRDFSRLTRNFEYTWYGQFNVSHEVYQMLRNDFLTFKQALPR
ncbi:MAG TPA: DUF4129 domain-containing protein [Flavisolibacter sp.]